MYLDPSTFAKNSWSCKIFLDRDPEQNTFGEHYQRPFKCIMLEIETQQELEERDDGLLEIYARYEYLDQTLLLQNINETCHELS